MGMSQVPAEQGGPAGNRTMHIGEGEGDLDIQWANGMAGRVPHVFYMVEGMPDFIAKWAAAMVLGHLCLITSLATLTMMMGVSLTIPIPRLFLPCHGPPREMVHLRHSTSSAPIKT